MKVGAVGHAVHGGLDGSSSGQVRPTRARRDLSPRRVVGGAAGGLPGAGRLRRLRHLGGVSERALHLRALSVAVLLAGDLRRRRARLVRPQAGVVAGAAAVLAGAPHPAVPRALPLHLLLLPRRLLQGVLGRPALVLGGRAARHAVPRRALVPAGAAERPPLLRLHRRHLPVRAVLRRVAGALVPHRGRRQGVRHRPRHDRPRRERRAAELATRSAATRSGTSSAAARTRSRSPACSQACYNCSSALNYKHQLFA